MVISFVEFAWYIFLRMQTTVHSFPLPMHTMAVVLVSLECARAAAHSAVVGAYLSLWYMAMVEIHIIATMCTCVFVRA